MANTNKREDKGFFTQLPIVLIDEYSDKMPATSFVAFVRFYRHYGYKGIFKGSIRKLCHALGMASTSIYRAIKDWVACGLVRKGEQKKIDENRDEMVLLIEGNDLWEQNIEHSKSFRECSKLEQSTSAEESSVPENRESVPNWNNNVPDRDKSVPGRNDFVPASSSKSPPKITEENSQITSDKTEDSDPMPPSSHPGDSSFNSSSNLQKNSENMAEIPNDLENESPPIANVAQETHNEHHSTSHDGQGYKTDDSPAIETPDSDALHSLQQAVVPNETAELLSWMKLLEQEEADEKRVRHFSVGRIAGDEEAMARLLASVASMDHLRDLYRSVRAQPRFQDGRIMYGLNLANAEAVASWQAANAPLVDPDLQPLTESTQEAVVLDIVTEYPALEVQAPNDANLGRIVLIWHGDGEADYMLIQCRADWKAWRVDPLLERALAYADCVLSREQEQLVAVAL